MKEGEEKILISAGREYAKMYGASVVEYVWLLTKRPGGYIAVKRVQYLYKDL
jgi:hypothetical protein